MFYILACSVVAVLIDLPQAVDAAGNNHAQAMLERDVGNLRNFFGRFAPELLATHFGGEIWALYEAGALTAASELTGEFVPEEKPVDLEAIVDEISDVRLEEEARIRRMQEE